MGIYVVTGGSGGIGGKTKEILLEQGYEVVNVDLKDGDICANLAEVEGREEVIRRVHETYPDGIDGLCCHAGVSGACGNLKLIVSLNYFGTTNLAHGLFDLLRKKGGSCVVTSSNTISQGAARVDLVDMLNYSQMKPINEERILSVVEKFDGGDLSIGNSIYVGGERSPDQCGGARKCGHAHDFYHGRSGKSRLGCAAYSNQLRERGVDGAGGYLQCDRLPGIPYGPRSKRQYHVRRRRHRRTSEFRESVLRRKL